MGEPKEIESSRGQLLRLNMTVEYISFSAHVDYTQNSQFIDECAPSHLFFVHGEVNEMMRLKNTIAQRNEKIVQENDEYSDIINKKSETDFQTVKLMQKQKIPYNSTFNLLKQILVEEFDAKRISIVKPLESQINNEGNVFVENPVNEDETLIYAQKITICIQMLPIVLILSQIPLFKSEGYFEDPDK
ncbi:unnamed protein product [Medioppia subpectinata]|uniref:Zn-dependent metallo-hydrolase RNA specificity domain-containing protein n=1 Tax=Medioppia subpectinata TaxID=1979941 RepID=A0A7R9KBP7_9ACAR|nr:unnamed protein product [Medioppia subpectinata]CAG2100469.1 unnamed protein product [Medioppia subpectinata]